MDNHFSNIKPLSGLYKDWFLDYASYVILERAIPNILDGLKPVQRRILHSLKELHDMVGKFQGEEMIDAREFEDLAGEYHRLHKTTMDSIKRVLGSLARA